MGQPRERTAYAAAADPDPDEAARARREGHHRLGGLHPQPGGDGAAGNGHGQHVLELPRRGGREDPDQVFAGLGSGGGRHAQRDPFVPAGRNVDYAPGPGGPPAVGGADLERDGAARAGVGGERHGRGGRNSVAGHRVRRVPERAVPVLCSQ